MTTSILVTGCGGFIGKFLLKDLLLDPENVVYGVDSKVKLSALVKSEYIPEEVCDRFVPLNLDLSKQSDCLDLPDVDFVFHLAAINGTSLFYEIPWEVFYHSTLTTINTLHRYNLSSRLKRFIYTSSSEVYASVVDQSPERCPTNERVPVGFYDVTNPRWSYGGAKLAGEIAAFAAGHQHDMPFSIIRYHNVYGPDMGLDHVIPDFINRGKSGLFELYGAENQRSFIYISDAIEATLAVAKSEEGLNRVVHVGSMDMITIELLAKKIMLIAGWQGEISHFSAPTGSTLNRCPDTTFLNSVIGFSPKISLDEGITRVVQSHNLPKNRIVNQI